MVRTLLIHVALLTTSLHAPPSMLRHDAAVLTNWTHTVLAPYWHVEANVKYMKRAPKGWWTLSVIDKAHISYGGIHNATNPPSALVFWEGAEWTQFLESHELAEMLVDPKDTGREICDRVQYWGYKKDGIWLSDFLTPNYYKGTKGKKDWLGLLH